MYHQLTDFRNMLSYIVCYLIMQTTALLIGNMCSTGKETRRRKIAILLSRVLER